MHGNTDLERVDDEPEMGRLRRMFLWAPSRANKLEAQFLGVLRYTALLVAALVLVGAVILLGLGLVRQLGPTAVNATQVSVSDEDLALLTDATAPAPQQAPQRKLGISEAIRKETLGVYRAGFRTYQRPDDKITDQQIVDFVWSEGRIDAFDGLAGVLTDKDGKVLPDRDAVMLNALNLVQATAATDEFKKRLSAYRNAQKTNVCHDETRTRARLVEGWNSYATDCANWYTSPVGCSATRVIDEPYTAKVCEMKFPDGLQAPSQQFADAVKRYAEAASAKLSQARNDADAKTAANMARKVEGHANMSTGGKLFLGFLAVMFLYLFVAMERHHRSLRALIERKDV